MDASLCRHAITGVHTCTIQCASHNGWVLIKGYLNMETMISESRGSLLFCLHVPFVLLSSFDSVVGCFAVLSISPLSLCFAFYFCLSFILLFARIVEFLSFMQWFTVCLNTPFTSTVLFAVWFVSCCTHSAIPVSTVLSWKSSCIRVELF